MLLTKRGRTCSTMGRPSLMGGVPAASTTRFCDLSNVTYLVRSLFHQTARTNPNAETASHTAHDRSHLHRPVSPKMSHLAAHPAAH